MELQRVHFNACRELKADAADAELNIFHISTHVIPFIILQEQIPHNSKLDNCANVKKLITLACGKDEFERDAEMMKKKENSKNHLVQLCYI